MPIYPKAMSEKLPGLLSVSPRPYQTKAEKGRGNLQSWARFGGMLLSHPVKRGLCLTLRRWLKQKVKAFFFFILYLFSWMFLKVLTVTTRPDPCQDLLKCRTMSLTRGDVRVHSADAFLVQWPSHVSSGNWEVLGAGGPGTTSLCAWRGCQDIAQLVFSCPEHW